MYLETRKNARTSGNVRTTVARDRYRDWFDLTGFRRAVLRFGENSPEERTLDGTVR